MAEKLSMESKDILSENIENIAELFPNALVETEDGKKIDFDILRQELSKDIVEGAKERYHLDFPGKREAIVEANRKINKTLRPIKEKSVDFDNTKNIYIEGDNLEALKILQESYLGKIKCIYIDPPYNTGNDFVYNDKFSHTTEEELKASGRMDEDGNILISKDINNDSNGRYHSDWLKMMYPRLKLARNLLSDDGVIFISIDDNEESNLSKLCDEIFGYNNFVGECIRKTKSMTADNKNGFNLQHEMLYIYAKNKNKIILFGDEKTFDNYSNPDNDINGDWVAGDPSAKSGSNSTYFEIVNPYTNKKDLPPEGRYWAFSKKTLELYIKSGKIKFKKEHTKNEREFIFKRYKKDINSTYNPFDSLFAIDNKYMNQNATTELRELLNFEGFDYPKPIEYLSDILSTLNKNVIILDFFSGSATAAHAVMKLNAEDSGNRQFILVQLPEAIDENSEAYKAGFKTICEIGEERIRRAGKKIKEENPMLTQNLDTGFRVYKVDSSNMKDIYYNPEKIDQANILNMVSNVKEDRTAEDLLTQVILNLGLPLDLHIDEKMVGKNKLFFVEENALVACFDETIDLNIIDEMAKVSPLKICLRESSFIKDQDKINFFEKLKKLSPDTEATII